jgi:hypothetical protein
MCCPFLPFLLLFVFLVVLVIEPKPSTTESHPQLLPLFFKKVDKRPGPVAHASKTSYT